MAENLFIIYDLLGNDCPWVELGDGGGIELDIVAKAEFPTPRLLMIYLGEPCGRELVDSGHDPG